jgi:hypothetical protein
MQGNMTSGSPMVHTTFSASLLRRVLDGDADRAIKKTAKFPHRIDPMSHDEIEAMYAAAPRHLSIRQPIMMIFGQQLTGFFATTTVSRLRRLHTPASTVFYESTGLPNILNDHNNSYIYIYI